MRLRHIPVSKIRPNPKNPRGIDIATQDPRLSMLKESIDAFGILVPLVVSKKDDTFLLIDGERRYVAARALRLKTVPAFVSDEGLSESEILYRMFQIHHNREQWGPIQQCNALEGVYQQITRSKSIQSIKDERARMKATADELARKTGIEPRTAWDRVRFLRWPPDVKKPLYHEPTDDYWYICEVEERVILPVKQNYPEYFVKVDVDTVRRDLYAKLEHRSVGKAVEVRHAARVFSSPMTTAKDRSKVKQILKQLHSNKAMTYAEAYEDFLEYFPAAVLRNPPSPARLLGAFKKLNTALEDFDTDSIKTSKKRAKAKPRDLSEAASALADSLQSFIDGMAAYVKGGK